MTNADLPYRELFDANPHPMWVYDRASLRFMAVNDAAVSHYGWTREEFLAMTIRDIRPTEELPALAEAVAAAGEGLVRSGVWRHRTKAGKEILVEIASHTRPFEGREARLVVAYDITAQEESAVAVRLSEERFRLVVRATSDTIWDWDLRTDTVWWNDEQRTLVGAGPPTPGLGNAPSSGDDWKTRIHADDRERVVKGIEAVIRGSGEFWSDEYRYIRTDGTCAIVANRGYVLRDNDGTPIRVVGGMTDLTERRELEAQFLRAQRLESIGTLAGGIAHDLNNMLSPILMSIDLLREHVQTAEGQDILTTIEASTQRGADLVRQVLTFARGVDGQRLRITVATLARDLNRVIVDTFPSRIGVRLDVPDGIWALIGDPTQVHQVFLNLCVNARDAMPAGGEIVIRAANVRLSERDASLIPDARAGNLVQLSVVDTGQGMTPRVRERIFEPFFTTKEVGKGTGLGLSIVQAIVRSHGGFVAVRSAPGEGTTFDVYLPAEPGAADAAGSKRRISGPRSAGELILLVDDEPNIRSFASQLMERRGYRVLTAADGDEAIAQFGPRASEVVLVITDLLMPGTDGRAVIRAIRRIAPGVPVIAMSGLDVHEPDADDVIHLMKPFTANQLDAAVHRALV